jgi:hypothetical protein|tara:strand:+ start:165 stop:488 length:324 start_codon:yes stop_codon:yes gene_type:complete
MLKPKKPKNVFVDPIVQFDHEEPERRLYMAVILQALLDATNVASKITKDRATAWFFCSVGVTCDNFEFICDSAGIEPTIVRGFAYDVINSEKKPDFKYRIYQILSER